MYIRPSNLSDLPAMEQVYEQARSFMAANGNPNQWGTAYPKREWLEQDIAENISYVCEEDGVLAATFMFIAGPDATYAVIEDGSWPDDEPYGVVHRIATGGARKGAAEFCLNWALEQCGNLRIDTHADNIPMQRLLEKMGFSYCGIIYVEDGTPRRAYTKKK